tara:strand:- start:965 stop:2173 length:1209 start_codon:yes stop_codon:yes gene_type:complete
MTNKQKIFGIILAFNDYKKFFNQNKELIKQLSLDYKKIYIINVIKLKLGEKNYTIRNKNIFPKNFKVFSFHDSKNFLNFFKNKKMIAIQYLDKNPDFFKIFFLIKLAKIKNIMIMNLGNFGNKQTPSFNKKNIFAFKHYYQKGFYYLFRIFTILNLFPKIDILFESNIEIIKNINNGLSKKFENLFPLLKISYFRNIKKINSSAFDQFKKNKKKNKRQKKYILYVDAPIDHGDRIVREGIVSQSIKENFYINVNNFLKNLSNIFNLKVIVGLHPSNKEGFKYLSNFVISKKRTIDLIPNCEIAVFTHSSLISNAAMFKKKILSIKSKYLGNYLSNLTSKYQKSLGLYCLDVDKELILNKNNCLKKMNRSIKNYNKYIKTKLKVDGDNLPYKKITNTIKKEFF